MSPNIWLTKEQILLLKTVMDGLHCISHPNMVITIEILIIFDKNRQKTIKMN